MEKIGSKPIDELVESAVKGNGLAFTALWDNNIDRLRMYIRSQIKNLDDLYVDDICSRSFEKAFRQISTFDASKGQFFTWLMTIARNTALDMVQQENRLHPKNMVVYLDETSGMPSCVKSLQDAIDTPLESIIKTECREENISFVERLPELYREVARKRLVDGLQYKEIASEMGMELNTVRTRLRRAKEMMERMKKEADEI